MNGTPEPLGEAFEEASEFEDEEFEEAAPDEEEFLTEALELGEFPLLPLLWCWLLLLPLPMLSLEPRMEESPTLWIPLSEERSNF